MRVCLLILGIGGAMHSGCLLAADLRSVEFEQQEERFIARIQVRLAAPYGDAFRIMQDFENLPRLNPAVLKADVLEIMPGMTRLQTRVRFCVLLICREINQVQDMRTFGLSEMNATVLPDKSDLAYGYAYWRFDDCAGETCLLFRTEIDPKFWVPPLIGPWAIKRALRHEALVTSEGIETAVRNGF